MFGGYIVGYNSVLNRGMYSGRCGETRLELGIFNIS